jgi:hypothetical protein
MQNEPNGMLFKPHFKLNNGNFGKFMKQKYAKRTQWYVIQNPICASPAPIRLLPLVPHLL